MNFLLFLAPFSWGTQKREAAAPKVSGCFMGGTHVLGRSRESRSREAAGRRNWPEAVPRKMGGRKRPLAGLGASRREETQEAANRAATRRQGAQALTYRG